MADVAAKECRVYIGTYTGSGSRGIYRLRLRDDGGLEIVGVAEDDANPAFLALHPSGRYLYAVNEVGNWQGRPGGAVAAWAVDPASGALTLLGRRSSGGAGPCHLSVEPGGRWVLVANYSAGSVAVLPVQADGSLGDPVQVVQHAGASVHPQRQRGPHAHAIEPDPAGEHALVPDLGLDKVLIYRLDRERGRLESGEVPWVAARPGAGPRHLAFHPSGQWAYVINELDSTLTAYRYQGGRLTPLQTISTLPASFAGENTCAHVQVHPSGQFLYGSNRGHDSLVICAIDQASGQLSVVGHQSTLGRVPRHFSLDPTGRFLVAANQESGTVVSFRVDAATGALQPTGHVVEVPKPVCVRMALV